MTTCFIRRLLVAVAGALAVSGCSLSEQEAPNPAAPSEFTLALTTSAVPDVLNRDGASVSTVTVTARDAQGRPVGGARIRLSFASAPAGTTLSAGEVTTSASGTATFEVIAPPGSSVGNNIQLLLTPIGDNFDNAVSRSISILVTPSNATSPTASFTFLPAAPTTNDAVTFDAGASTDEGVVCGTNCTYAWSFGDGTTASGVTASKQFSTTGARTITLTVTDASGASGSTSRSVTVEGPAAPVAGTIVFGPTPVRINQVTNFDAGSATVGAGATIVDYTWFWGDGTNNTVTANPQAQHTFTVAGVYTVRVTVRDNLGRTASSTVTVTVTN